MIIEAAIVSPDTAKVTPATAASRRTPPGSTSGLTQRRVALHLVPAAHSRACLSACLRLLALNKYWWVPPSASMTAITKNLVRVLTRP